MKRRHIVIMIALCIAIMPMLSTSAFATDEAATKENDLIAEYGTYHGTNAKRIPVITYHRFSSNKNKVTGSSLYVTQGTFDKQMKWLKSKGYRTINCEEFYLWYKGKIKLPKKTVLITFDDGRNSVAKYALPVLKKYKMKGTCFVIGSKTLKNKKGYIKYDRMRDIQEEYPDLEFQSHTYKLHKFFSSKGDYGKVLKDAEKQKEVYGFEYLAYPYGRYTNGMIKAYKKSGIKLAFTYGRNGYATRKQNIYKIRRIKISGTGTFNQFKRWFE